VNYFLLFFCILKLNPEPSIVRIIVYEMNHSEIFDLENFKIAVKACKPSTTTTLTSNSNNISSHTPQLDGEEVDKRWNENLFRLYSRTAFPNKETLHHCIKHIYAMNVSKTIETTRDVNYHPKGSEVIKYKCNMKDCSFYCAFKKSKENTYKMYLYRKKEDKMKDDKRYCTEESFCHFITLPNGYIDNCTSSYSIGYQDGMKDDIIRGIFSKNMKNDGKIIPKYIDSCIKECKRLGVEVSESLGEKISANCNRVLLQTEQEDINLLEPLLQAWAENTSLKYKVVRELNKPDLERLMILPSYTKEYCLSEYDTKFYGIDTAHMRDLVMNLEVLNEIEGEEGITHAQKEMHKFVFSDHKLAVLSTRTPNQNMLVLALGVIYTESTLEVGELLSFVKDNGVPLDDEGVTIITDRSRAINRAIEEQAPKAYHALCPLHIERNLRANKWTEHLMLYYYARKAETEDIFKYRMEMIKEKCLPMYNYLMEMEGKDSWQCYRYYERHNEHGNMMFNALSDNIVEQVFSYFLKARGFSYFLIWSSCT
jgi:hypothetical protein